MKINNHINRERLALAGCVIRGAPTGFLKSLVHFPNQSTAESRNALDRDIARAVAANPAVARFITAKELVPSEAEVLPLFGEQLPAVVDRLDQVA